MRTIYYKVAVLPEEEQFFLIAMELLMFKCKKDYEEITPSSTPSKDKEFVTKR